MTNCLLIDPPRVGPKISLTPLSRASWPCNDILISHHSDDQEEICALHRRLTRLGFTCWMDAHNRKHGIDKNDDRETRRREKKQLNKRIKDCRVYIVSLTKKYAKSKSIRLAVSRMDVEDKHIIPILLEKSIWTPPTPPLTEVFGSMSTVFAPLMYIDFTDPATRTTWCCPSFVLLTNRLLDYDIRPVVETTNKIDVIKLDQQLTLAAPTRDNPTDASGVAVLRGRSYVTYWSSRYIRVYDEESSERLEDIYLRPIEAAEGNVSDELAVASIVACCVRRCLYVNLCPSTASSDEWFCESYSIGDGSGILRLMDDGRGEQDLWLPLVGNDYDKDLRRQMSVSPDGRLILVGMSPPRIEIRGFDAALEYTVPLPSDGTEPTYAVQRPPTYSGNFVVCMFGLLTRGEVREYTREGVLMWSWVNDPAKLCAISAPVSMTVDDAGRVYVLDGLYHVMTVFDSTLSVFTDLVSERKSRAIPTAMCFSAYTGRVIVLASSNMCTSHPADHLYMYKPRDQVQADHNLSASSQDVAACKDIFISYQWGEQKEDVRALCARLVELGFSCWIDIKELGGGVNLNDAMEKGVAGSKVVMSCVTKRYLESINCRFEIEQCAKHNKIIVPLLIESMEWPPPGPMGLVLGPLSYIDFTDSYARTQWLGVYMKPLLIRPADADIIGDPLRVSLEMIQLEMMFQKTLWRFDGHTEEVSAITNLLGRVYIFNNKYNIMNVYNCETFELLDSFTLSAGDDEYDTMYIEDVEACTTCHCLYMFDSNAKAMLRMMEQSRGQLEVWLKLTTGKSYSRSFSVTPDGRVLLVGDDRLSSRDYDDPSGVIDYQPRLDIYDSDATLVKTVTLPSEFIMPYHAMETPSGDFVISYGSSSASSWVFAEFLSSIGLVSRDGQLLASYDSRSRGRETELIGRLKLLMDANGHVYFLDLYDNNRFVVLHPTLGASKVLQDEGNERIEVDDRGRCTHVCYYDVAETAGRLVQCYCNA